MNRLILGLIFSMLSSSCATADTNLGFVLQATKEVVVQATTVEVARLKPGTANDVLKTALSPPNTMAGFTITGDVKQLPPDRLNTIRKVILNPENYADILQRCADTSLIGIRFTHQNKVVEFAYSQPCMQAFWAVEIAGNVQYEGAVLGPEYGKAILDLL